MKLERVLLVVAGLVAGAFLSFAIPRASARESGECSQWEVTLGPTSATITTSKPQDYGKAVVEKAPSGGWEPFAYNPGGSLVYRRCAP